MRIVARVGPDGVRHEIKSKHPPTSKWERFKDLVLRYPEATASVALTVPLIATLNKPSDAVVVSSTGALGVFASIVQDIVYKQMPRSIRNAAQFAGTTTLVAGTVLIAIALHTGSTFGAIAGVVELGLGQMLSMGPAIGYGLKSRKKSE